MTTNYKLNDGCKQFKDYLLNIPKYFNENTTTIHKARNELKIINFNDTDTVVKSFKVPHFINKIIYTYIRESKAKRSYEYSIKIKDFVPKPIGYIEFIKDGFIDESYFISERFNYDFTIREALKRNIKDVTEDDYIKIYQAFALFTYELHQNNIFHDDYSPGNILIKKEEDEYIFKIVDINRMAFNPLDSIQRAKNFEKLWANDYILEVMAKEYITHYKDASDSFIDDVLYFSNKNKKIKNFKKRLKGKPVTD